MKLYLACSGCVAETYPYLRDWLLEQPTYYELRSYIEYEKFTGHDLPVFGKDFFLDCGAFSAWSDGREIDIEEYCAFYRKHAHKVHVFANLDVIPKGKSIGPEHVLYAARRTLENQQWFEKQSLKPLPVFHAGEPYEYLEYYVANYEYICLGGLVKRIVKTHDYFDFVWEKYLTDSAGRPKCKVHAFGMTSFKHLFNYPWHSCDSSSWLVQATLGQIYLPHRKRGPDGKTIRDQKRNFVYDYSCSPYILPVSDRSSWTKKYGKHTATMSERQRRIVQDYLDTIEIQPDISLDLESCETDHVARQMANAATVLRIQDFGKYKEVYKKRQVQLL